AGSGEVGAQEGLQALFLDQAGVLAVDLGLGGAGGPGGGGDEQGEAGEAGGVADGGVQQGAGAHGGADAVHLLAGEPVVEQPEQVVGEDGPAVVLGDGAAGGPAVAAGVVAQQAGAGQAAAEIEIHEAVAVTAGGEAVELDDGVATLVAQFDIEFGAGNGEGRHGGSRCTGRSGRRLGYRHAADQCRASTPPVRPFARLRRLRRSGGSSATGVLRPTTPCRRG